MGADFPAEGRTQESTDTNIPPWEDETRQLLEETGEKMTRDMKFVSIFTIITGILYSLTFIGAIFGIPLIIAGIRLRDSANAYASYINSPGNYNLEKAFRYQQKFFFIGKVIIIIGIVLFILYFVGIFFFFNHMMDSMEMLRNYEGQMV